MTSGATAHLAFCPVAGVLVERADGARPRPLPRSSTCRCGAGSTRPGGSGTSPAGGSRPISAATRSGDGTALFELGGFYRETVAFLDALAAGRAPSPSLRESRQSVEIAERIRHRAAEYRA